MPLDKDLRRDDMQTKVFNGSSFLPVYSMKPYNGEDGRFFTWDGDSFLPLDGREQPLYKFGALSDTHIQYNTGVTDFAASCDYLKNNGASFACMCGDLTDDGDDESLAEYKSYVDTYAVGLPFYAVSGNHEGYKSDVEGRIETYTGHPLYYKVVQGNDVFIFLGVKSNGAGSLFTADEIGWLRRTLETHRNQRCFLFEHVRPDDACGNAYGIYAFDIWGGNEATEVEDMLKHYKNVIFFHGHSHLKFELAKSYGIGANIDTTFGMYSIHIPSITVPRDGGTLNTEGGRRQLFAKSEGYLVEVYEDRIKLKGFELAEYDPTDSKFNTGDCCRHDGKLYIANTDITSNEPWTPAHWDLSPSDYVVEYELNTTLTNIPAYEVDHITTPAELAEQSSWEMGSINTNPPYAEFSSDNNFRSKLIAFDSTKTYRLVYTRVFSYGGMRFFYYDALGICLGCTGNVVMDAEVNATAPADTAYWRIRTYGGSNNEGYNYLTQAFSFTVS